MIDYIFKFKSETQTAAYFKSLSMSHTSRLYIPLGINNLCVYDPETKTNLWDTSRVVIAETPKDAFYIWVCTDLPYKVFTDKAIWYSDRDNPKKLTIDFSPMCVTDIY